MVVLVGLDIFFVSCFPKLIVAAPLVLPRRLLAKAFEIVRILCAPLSLIDQLTLALARRIGAYLLAWPVFTGRKFAIAD